MDSPLWRRRGNEHVNVDCSDALIVVVASWVFSPDFWLGRQLNLANHCNGRTKSTTLGTYEQLHCFPDTYNMQNTKRLPVPKKGLCFHLADQHCNGRPKSTTLGTYKHCNSIRANRLSFPRAKNTTYNLQKHANKKTNRRILSPSHATSREPQHPTQPFWSLKLPILESFYFSIDITFDF